MDNIIKYSDFGYEKIEENIDDMFIEKIQIMKYLALSSQINSSSFFETLKNLYFYYMDVDPYNLLPDIFYEDFIIISSERYFYRANFDKCIYELKELHKKNK